MDQWNQVGVAAQHCIGKMKCRYLNYPSQDQQLYHKSHPAKCK
nr:hypothetical protein Iba_chr12bCG26880 [Ipomoea batatas]